MGEQMDESNSLPNASRRKFMTGAAAFTGYSMLVKAPQALASDNDPFVRREDVVPRIDELAPDDAKPNISSSDPNMRVVNLESDVLVAGGGLAGVCAAQPPPPRLRR